MNHFLSKVYHFKRSAMALCQDENNGTDQIKAFFIKAGKNGNLIYLLGRKLTILNEVKQSEELLFGILFR